MTNLIDLITPTNLVVEQEKFFSSKKYNPTFHYIWQDSNLDPTFSIKAKYPLWEAIKSQNHALIVDSASKLFEVNLNDETLNRANNLAKVRGKISDGNAEEYVDLMREGLKVFNLPNFNVVLTDEVGFNARPNHLRGFITVSKHIHFEYFSMEGGVRHELVHVLRYQNGKFNGIKRSRSFLPTEEGLASWCQDNANDDNGLAQHGIEYVASAVGVNGSLRDVYNVMRELGMSSDLAWKRASRHKFGFINTQMPGDILKPAMYYANEEKVAALNTEEKLRLFVGKISISDLFNYQDYEGMWSQKLIKEYFKL